jgi:hypothetical protein
MQTENALQRKRRLKSALAVVMTLLVLSAAALLTLKFFCNSNDGRSGTIFIEAGTQRHEEPIE